MPSVAPSSWSGRPGRRCAGAIHGPAGATTRCFRSTRPTSISPASTAARRSSTPKARTTFLAELNIAAEDFPAARRALGDLATADPTTRSLTIMAAIERGEGADDAVVRGWLARALTAPRGPQWVCDNCHHVEGAWHPVCSNCGAFNSLSWTAPPTSEVALPAETEMLPLIVGRVAPPADPAPEVAPGTVWTDAAPAPSPAASPEPEPAAAPVTVSDPVRPHPSVTPSEPPTEAELVEPAEPAGDPAKTA